MVRGFHSSRSAGTAPRRSRCVPYYASHPGGPQRPGTLLPDRRGLWFASSLAGCGVALCSLGIAYFATLDQREAATVPVPGALRAVATADGFAQRTTYPVVAPSIGPLATGSVQRVATASAVWPVRPQAARPVPASLPRVAGFGPAEATRRPGSAVMQPQRRSADKPRVLEKSDPPLRLASLGDAPSVTVLSKRPPPLAARPQTQHTVVAAKGDTLSDILSRYEIAPAEAKALIEALSKVYKPSELRPGQEIVLTLREASDGAMLPLALSLTVEGRDIAVTREGEARYAAEGAPLPATGPEHHRAMAAIEGSLYGTARGQKVPDSIIVRMMRTHSYDVDFQREIKKGDVFEMLYAAKGSDSGRTAPGTLLYSSLSTKGKTRSYYRYTTADGETDYYDENGVSSKKPLMKTPINGARISSRFGMRRHPISGYNRMHAGVDFAAPTGTPVLAAGDGVVEFSGRHGGYGKYIRLKHRDGVKTAYAHLSRYAKGIKPGKKVHQGQTIGFGRG